LKAARPLEVRTAASSLELTYLTLDRPESAARNPSAALHSRPLVRQSVPIPALRQPRPLDQQSAAAPAEGDNAIHPPIDWANELSRTARESVSGASTPQPREFGAVHVAPTAPSKRAEFGWSHSRTHRLEAGPGSTDVHWGDHCVIAFTPLPFPVCKLGKKDANGDLFKHMRDPPQPDDSKDPP
jgi:hypothetical protein